MNEFIVRISKLIFGLFIYSLGLVLSINANIGLAPWDAFSIGVSLVSGISYGKVSIITGIFILFIVVIFLKEKIGLGTILNTILIGAFVDMLQSLNVIPYMTNFFLGILMLLTGQLVVSIASYFYISTGLGCGPRDSLMVGLSKKFSNVPIGAIRGGIEGTVLIIGWILGAKVGLGTVIAVFGMGFIIQTTFKLFHFDVKSVIHESILQTIVSFKTSFKKSVENE
nr:hypothetical protein [Sedimentibacter sp.]